MSLCGQELVRLINSSRVTVISGETGCGKTTQVTQFILDDHIERGLGSTCRIVCTQPRRISAISVSALPGLLQVTVLVTALAGAHKVWCPWSAGTAASFFPGFSHGLDL